MSETSASESTAHILVEFDAGVCTITFNRPKKKNAFTIAMYTRIVEAFAEARGRGDVRVILLCGSEGVFTAGNDLMDFMKTPPTSSDSPVAQFLDHLLRCEKPLVAAVQGPAIGLGVTMLSHCDLVYAGESARFHMPFINLALCPEAGSSYLMPRLMGYRRAAELLFLGEPFTAEVAREYGLINQILADGAVLDRARSIAASLASKPPAALRKSKQLLRAGTQAAVAEAMDAEFASFAEALRSPEAAEAFQAFFDKRAPDFSKFE